GGLRVEADKNIVNLPIKVMIRPFRLKRPTDLSFINCITSLKSLTKKDMLFLKKSGFDGFEIYVHKPSGLSLTNENGRPLVHMNNIDTLMRNMVSAGMKGPMLVMLSNDSKTILENRICEAFSEFKLTETEKIYGKAKMFGPIGNPRFDSLYLDAIGQIKSSVESFGFEFIPVIFDEAKERFFPELPVRHKLIKSRFPNVRIANTPQGDYEWARVLLPYSDILITGGEFEPTSYLCKREKKSLWLNSFLGSTTDPGKARVRFGLRNWKYNPSALLVWSYNYYSGFEGLSYPPLPNGDGEPLETPGWIGVREAVDDLSYVKMLEELSSGKPEAASIPWDDLKYCVGDYGLGRHFDGYEFPRDFSQLDSTREFAARMIVKLLKK
ncbi:MAG: hypothetical protein JNL74_05885, partial [Fibrobacteres bacterium]|nr:hypothetical protein [Fibrobacterota bacterium]